MDAIFKMFHYLATLIKRVLVWALRNVLGKGQVADEFRLTTQHHLFYHFGWFTICALPVVALASLIFDWQLYYSRHRINTQAARFHVESNSMKELMWSIEKEYDPVLVHSHFSVHSHETQYYIGKLNTIGNICCCVICIIGWFCMSTFSHDALGKKSPFWSKRWQCTYYYYNYYCYFFLCVCVNHPKWARMPYFVVLL